MNKSDSIMNLATALVSAQPQIETAKMDSVNPFFKSKYADLGAVWDAVREALKVNKLTVAQFPDAIGQEPALTTMLIHESGEWISGTYPLMVTDKESTPQGYGSALTYARRYGLSSVLGVIADTDDDGNASSRAPKPATSPTQKPQEAKTPVPAPGGPPKMTPKQWGLDTLDTVRSLKGPELDAFVEKNTLALVKLRGAEPDLHRDILALVQLKQANG